MRGPLRWALNCGALFLPRGNGGGAARRAAVGASDSTILLRRRRSDESDAPTGSRSLSSGRPLRAGPVGSLPPPFSRGRMKTSNLVLAMRLRIRALLQATLRKAPPLKEGRRSADRRIQRKPHLAMRRALCLFSSPACAEEERGSALAFRRSTAALRRGFTLDSARAALPGITGCKRENPLRHQCSEHLAVRSRAGRVDAQAARARGHEPRPREPLSLRFKDRL